MVCRQQILKLSRSPLPQLSEISCDLVQGSRLYVLSALYIACQGASWVLLKVLPDCACA